MATKKAGSSKKAATKKAATKKAAATPEVSDDKLKDLQKRLNEDPRLRGRFLKTPGAVLRQAGIELGTEKESKLMTYLGGLTAPQREVFGANLIKVRVGVSVRIRIIVNIGVTL